MSVRKRNVSGSGDDEVSVGRHEQPHQNKRTWSLSRPCSGGLQALVSAHFFPTVYVKDKLGVFPERNQLPNWGSGFDKACSSLMSCSVQLSTFLWQIQLSTFLWQIQLSTLVWQIWQQVLFSMYHICQVLVIIALQIKQSFVVCSSSVMLFPHSVDRLSMIFIRWHCIVFSFNLSCCQYTFYFFFLLTCPINCACLVFILLITCFSIIQTMMMANILIMSVS